MAIIIEKPMKQLKFLKENNNNWHVYLPEWTGPKSDLLMIGGADTMLDIISEGEKEVKIWVSETHFENSDEIVFTKKADDIGEGAYYKLKKYQGVELNHELFLCDVMLFVFDNKFPERIFIKKVELKD